MTDETVIVKKADLIDLLADISDIDHRHGQGDIRPSCSELTAKVRKMLIGESNGKQEEGVKSEKAEG